jgi:AAA domain
MSAQPFDLRDLLRESAVERELREERERLGLDPPWLETVRPQEGCSRALGTPRNTRVPPEGKRGVPDGGTDPLRGSDRWEHPYPSRSLDADLDQGTPRNRVRTARELCALPDPPETDELLGSLIVRRQRIVVGAHTGEGKTTIALQIVRAVVAGEEFLDWHGRSGQRALVIDAEQGLKTIKRRLREAALEETDLVDYLRVPDGLGLDSNEQDIAEVEAILAAGGYGIVAADPLYKLHDGNSNDEREAVNLMRRFDAWRDAFGFALLLPVHLRKPIPGEKFSIHDVFGSSAYVRGAEVVLGLRRVSNGFAELSFFKDRDGDLPVGDKWGLIFDHESGFRRAPEDEVDSEETLAARLLEFVRENPGESTKKVTEAVEGRKQVLTEILRNDDRFRSERRGTGDYWFEAAA